jgi:hypothetical protein
MPGSGEFADSFKMAKTVVEAENPASDRRNAPPNRDLGDIDPHL